MGGGGSTSTMGAIAPELRGLYQSSANALVGQQGQNPLGQYNEAHPMDVAGSDALQQYGAGMMMGGNLPTGLDGLTLQSILRQPGLAGAGPTTGRYDYGSEAGLGDIMGFMNPSFGTAPGLDNYARGSTADLGFTNEAPRPGAAPEDYSGVADALRTTAPPQGAGGIPGIPGQQGLPTGNGSPTPPAGGGAGVGAGMSGSDLIARAGAAKPGGIQSGWGTSLGDLNQRLSSVGITASGGGMGGLNLSGGGRSYTNVGGSHEGAGPGGQSQFLSDVIGNGGGDRNAGYRANAGLDAEIAGVAQRMRNAESSGLDANTSPAALAEHRAQQRANDPALAAWAARRGQGQTAEQTLAAAQPNRRR